MAHYHGPALSRGTLRCLVTGTGAVNFPITLQVVDVKQIGAQGAAAGQGERFRLIVSDGENYQQAMLATQLNDLVNSGEIINFTVVQVQECAPCERDSGGAAAGPLFSPSPHAVSSRSHALRA
jgi:hypothetical protein